MNRARRSFALPALVLAAGGSHAAAQTALDTGFSYQGRLTDNGAAPTALYDFQFKLFDAASAGTQIGATVPVGDLQVASGLFTTILNFGAQFTGNKRWLQIEVRPGASTGLYTPLATRQELTATPYSLFSALPWATNPTGISYNGFAAIGAAPAINTRLYLQGSVTADTAAFKSDRGPNYSHIHFGPNGDWYIRSAASAGNVNIQDNPNQGLVGIGTASPSAKLMVVRNDTGHGFWAFSQSTANDINFGAAGSTSSSNVGSAGLYGEAAAGYGVRGVAQGNNYGVWGDTLAGFAGVYGTGPTNGVYGLSNNASASGVYGQNTGTGVGVAGYSASGDGVSGSSNGANHSGVVGASFNASGYGGFFYNTAGGVALKSDGLTQIKCMQIYGGCDLAEPFDIGPGVEPGATTVPIQAGMVVVIDPDHPGRLRLGDSPYDAKVAGIISGANNLNPGMVLKSEGQMDGDFPVAMTGRVWCYVDASLGAITPGDRLTTSPTPGHAMKADDPARSQGAVIGKAMTRLDGGKGLVLVLVNLQ